MKRILSLLCLLMLAGLAMPCDYYQPIAAPVCYVAPVVQQYQQSYQLVVPQVRQIEVKSYAPALVQQSYQSYAAPAVQFQKQFYQAPVRIVQQKQFYQVPVQLQKQAVYGYGASSIGASSLSIPAASVRVRQESRGGLLGLRRSRSTTQVDVVGGAANVQIQQQSQPRSRGLFRRR